MPPGQKPRRGLVFEPAALPQHRVHPAPEQLLGDGGRQQRERGERPRAIDNARHHQGVQMRLPVGSLVAIGLDGHHHRSRLGKVKTH
jgi:hypothetical protein